MVEMHEITNQDKEIRICSKMYSMSIKEGNVLHMLFFKDKPFYSTYKINHVLPEQLCISIKHCIA